MISGCVFSLPILILELCCLLVLLQRLDDLQGDRSKISPDQGFEITQFLDQRNKGTPFVFSGL